MTLESYSGSCVVLVFFYYDTIGDCRAKAVAGRGRPVLNGVCRLVLDLGEPERSVPDS